MLWPSNFYNWNPQTVFILKQGPESICVSEAENRPQSITFVNLIRRWHILITLLLSRNVTIDLRILLTRVYIYHLFVFRLSIT